MDNFIDVVVVAPGEHPQVKRIPNTLKSLQKEVDGYIETVHPFDDPVVLICNEEGKINGSALNRAIRDENGKIQEIIAGTFLIAGAGEEDFCSLNKELTTKFYNRFWVPEQFISINNQIAVLPTTQLQEAVYLLDDDIYLHIERKEQKYTFYDHTLVKSQEGRIENPNLALSAIRDEVLAESGLSPRTIDKIFLLQFEQMKKDAAAQQIAPAFLFEEDLSGDRMGKPDDAKNIYYANWFKFYETTPQNEIHRFEQILSFSQAGHPAGYIDSMKEEIYQKFRQQHPDAPVIVLKIDARNRIFREAIDDALSRYSGKQEGVLKEFKPYGEEVVGRIDFLNCYGDVGGSIEYTDAAKIVEDILEENKYSAPMSIVLYRDCNGNTIPTDFLEDLNPITSRFAIVDSPYLSSDDKHKQFSIQELLSDANSRAGDRNGKAEPSHSSDKGERT